MTYSTFLLVFLMAMHYHVTTGTNKFTLEEVISQKVIARSFNGKWTSGTDFLYTDDATGNVMLYNVASQSASLLVEAAELAGYYDASFVLSPDGQYLLIGYETQPVYRHSYLAKYTFYDLERRVFIPLLFGELLQLVIFAPQGNSVAYVYKNDVYYKPNPEDLGFRITFSGESGAIFNGIADWIYEEEVTGSAPVMSFSPDGRWLSYLIFNDTNVKTQPVTLYGEPGTPESQYSHITKIHYPKPGTPIPEVSIGLVEVGKILNRPEVLHIAAPKDIPYSIIHELKWISEDEFAPVFTNRVQNEAFLFTCTVVDMNVTCQEVYRWSEKNGWVQPPGKTLFDDKGRILMVLPQPQEPGEGNFEHLTLFHRKETVSGTASTETPLTSGRYVVTALYGWDQVNDVIYYQATPKDKPSQLQVYALSLAENGRVPQCLSCEITTLEGNLCQYATASFSTDLSHMALTCSGPDPTQVFLARADLNSEPMTTWDDNTELRELISDKSLPNQLDLTFPIEEGMFAQVRLYLPPDADLSGNTKYPLLVYVYGGPNSVVISDVFSIGWHTYLTTNRNIIYAMIDGRGSGLRGDKMKFSTYRQLGTNEIYDQINISRQLQDTYAFIDAERSAIWGWSYGGYATSMALARDDKHVFKCGISVAPVTSWMYYDSAYTERYMGLPTPEDNLEGYNNGDVTRLTEGFRNKSFYLIHGNADDNVHYLQAMMLSRALELKGILFQQQSYPNEDHSLKGVKPHLYLSMDQFWTRCFGL